MISGKDDEAESKKRLNPESQLSLLTRFNQEALRQHNIYRQKHHCDPLKINNELMRIAQNYADEMMRTNSEKHSECLWGQKVIGESLHVTINKPFDGRDMTDEFYEEKTNYDFEKGEYESRAVRFTQMIWKGTTEVGFGIARTPNGKYFGVANYFPSGNLLGEFKTNIQRDNN